MTAIPKPTAAPRKPSASHRISQIMQLLQQLPRSKATDELYREVCSWIQELPPGGRPDSLLHLVSQVFGKSLVELEKQFERPTRKLEFEQFVPASGLFADYLKLTASTEPPTVFHFFVLATVIGAALGRRVHFNKGAYKIYPNLCVMIIAPSGTCRKTSAANIGTKLLVKSGGTLVGGDKPTPEALVDALKDSAEATGLIYAPELAVFLGKQKYQEGMVPLLTALFDCPDEWTSKTIGRGEVSLSNVALSSLFCSTLDWIQTGIAKDAFGGGFMSRFLFVIQESTPRSFPLPPPFDDVLQKAVIERLKRLSFVRGPFLFTPESEAWYVQWYRSRTSSHGDKRFAGYYERKPDHLIRLGLILKSSQILEAGQKIPKELFLERVDLEYALGILDWLEDWMPTTFDEMTTSSAGEDQKRLLQQLKQAGGSIEHSALLRKNSGRLNAEQFRRAIATLREAKLVEFDGPSRIYYLTSEGWA